MNNYRYPKTIWDDVSQIKEMPENVMADFETGRYDYELADSWIATTGRMQLLSVKKYMHFIESMYETFSIIAKNFIMMIPEKKGCKDEINTASSPMEMLAIASYLYILDSYGIQGDVLECGCFNGFSSCCLSIACAKLNKKLIVADSFEGLPDYEEKGGYYLRGDFCGALETVKSNIETFGDISSVEFIKGFFEKSLKNFSIPLCAIWMDVDLYQSTMDVLKNAFDRLHLEGLIFSHEMQSTSFTNGYLNEEQSDSVARAFIDFSKQNDLVFKGYYLSGYTAVFSTKTTPIIPSNSLMRMINPNEMLHSSLNVDQFIPSKGFLEYTVDECSFDVIMGWAIDKLAKKPLAGIYVVSDNIMIPINYGETRNDVMFNYRCNDLKYTGFVSPPTCPHIQRKNSAEMIFLSSDATAYQRVTIKHKSNVFKRYRFYIRKLARRIRREIRGKIR